MTCPTFAPVTLRTDDMSYILFKWSSFLAMLCIVNSGHLSCAGSAVTGSISATDHIGQIYIGHRSETSNALSSTFYVAAQVYVSI